MSTFLKIIATANLIKLNTRKSQDLYSFPQLTCQYTPFSNVFVFEEDFLFPFARLKKRHNWKKND